MKFSARLLSDEERARVHGESLKILEQIGVKLHSPKALELLGSNGAKIDRDSGVARIPQEMVDAALESAPKSFVLGARNPDHDFALPAQQSGYNLDAGGMHFLDFRSGERRPGLFQDHVDMLRVFEQMSMGNIVWTHSVEDVPDHRLTTVRMSLDTLKHSSKHLQDELLFPEEVPYLMEGLEALLGSEEEVRRRKIYSVCYCTIPPLTHDKHMCEAYLELGKYEVPILLLPMNAPGTSSPASLYSTLAVSNAENLSSLVLFQIANPGCPIIYGDANLATDFRTGNFLCGAPEMVVQTGGLGEMARFYGLPNEQGGCLSDALELGPQAVMEKMLTTLPLVLSGVDVVQGMGAIENSNTVALEQIVVDNEIALQCRTIREGIDVSERTAMYEEIARTGPGGMFLDSEITVQACRSGAFYESGLVNRAGFDAWVQLGRPDMYSKAREIVEEILASAPQHPLSDDQAGKLDEIIRRIDRRGAAEKQ